MRLLSARRAPSRTTESHADAASDPWRIFSGRAARRAALSLLIESMLVIGRACTAWHGASYRSRIRYYRQWRIPRERKPQYQRRQHCRATQPVRGRQQIPGLEAALVHQRRMGGGAIRQDPEGVRPRDRPRDRPGGGCRTRGCRPCSGGRAGGPRDRTLGDHGAVGSRGAAVEIGRSHRKECRGIRRDREPGQRQDALHGEHRRCARAR